MMYETEKITVAITTKLSGDVFLIALGKIIIPPMIAPTPKRPNKIP